MKVNDVVKISDSVDNHFNIPVYNLEKIAADPIGIIYKVYKDTCEVRTVSGIWEFNKINLEVQVNDNRDNV